MKLHLDILELKQMIIIFVSYLKDARIPIIIYIQWTLKKVGYFPKKVGHWSKKVVHFPKKVGHKKH